MDSDPFDRNRHYAYCLTDSGVLRTLDPGNWAGDKEFVGYGMITPCEKPWGGRLLDYAFAFIAPGRHG